MAAQDIVNRTFREFRRYTGDGKPGEPVNAPLPIGDPQSGVNNPSKAEMRDALLAPIIGGKEAAQEVIDANLPVILEARNDAVTSAATAVTDAVRAEAAAGAAEAIAGFDGYGLAELLLTSSITAINAAKGIHSRSFGAASVADGFGGSDGFTATTVDQIPQAAGAAFGNLTSGGGLAAAFDGNSVQASGIAANSNPTLSAGYIGKNFGAAKRQMVSALVTGSSDVGFDTSTAAATITVNLRASNALPSSGSNGTLLATAAISDAPGASVSLSSIDAGSQWQYVWVELTSNTVSYIAIAEVQFFTFTGSFNFVWDATIGRLVPSRGYRVQIPQAAGSIIGNMSANGGLAAAFDGTTVQTAAQSANSNPVAQSGYIGKNFSALPRRIVAANVWGASDTGYDSSTGAGNIVLTLRAKNGSPPSSATDGTILGSTSTVDAAGIVKSVVSSDQVTLYDHVWVHLVSDTVSYMAVAEIQFFEPGPCLPMDVKTIPVIASASPSSIAATLIIRPIEALTLNTDVILQLSRNGGATWMACTLVQALEIGPDRLLRTGDVLISGAAGTSICARITTPTGKNVEIRGLRLEWK